MNRVLLAAVLCLGASALRAQGLEQAYESAVSGLRSGAVPGQAAPPTPPSAPEAVRDDEIPPELLEMLKTLPGTDTGKSGRPDSPLSLVFIGGRKQIKRALKDAAWTGVPRRGVVSFIEGLGQLVAGAQLTKFPPFHSYRVEGRTQDLNESKTVHALTKRHHFRLWRLAERAPGGREVWWGSASYDTGFRWKRGVPVTHNTDPDLSAERDYVARTLAHAPGVARLGLAALPQIPKEGVNDQKDRYFTDGRALVVEFSSSPLDSSGAGSN